MVVKIGDYTIDINAKRCREKEYSNESTYAFLTHLCCALIDSREWQTFNHHEFSAKFTQEEIDDINKARKVFTPEEMKDVYGVLN